MKKINAFDIVRPVFKSDSAASHKLCMIVFSNREHDIINVHFVNLSTGDIGLTIPIKSKSKTTFRGFYVSELISSYPGLLDIEIKVDEVQETIQSFASVV